MELSHPRFQEFFAGKKITLMGLGLLGRGVGDAEFLAPLCEELLITDLKTESELAGSVARLKNFSNIRFVLGEHRTEDFLNRDMIIKGPGVPLRSPYIAAAREAQVPVYMSTALFATFARQAGATLVGVTGTRGKSTVTHLIYHGLVRADRPAHLGGNIRGQSTLATLPAVAQGDVCVLELDSWQLQGYGDLQLSPDIAVFTNFMPDHLNYYPDEAAYFADKANIFKFQKNNDVLIVGSSVKDIIVAAAPPVAPIVPPDIPDDWRLQIIGVHNRENAALAAEALRVLQLSEREIRDGLEWCGPVEGRLELIREVNGVRIYNDNNATTPQATVAGLRALRGETIGTIVLIVGGADKNIDLSELISEIGVSCSKVVMLAGTGTERLRGQMDLAVAANILETSVASALKSALQGTNPGDVVLFSPAFASFGLFKNEYDRNDQFVAAVQALPE